MKRTSGDGPVCQTCNKQLAYKFGNRVYVGNQIAQLMLSLTKSVMTRSLTPAEGVTVALDLVEKLPPWMGWDLLKSLLYVCTPRVYIAPLISLHERQTGSLCRVC